MSIGHVGGKPALPVVPQQQSAPTAPSDATSLDRNLLPDVWKTLPAQAKGAAEGHSVDKVFARWDKDGDGTITQAEAGGRWGHGLLGELLKLQEQGATAPATNDPGSAAPGTGDTGAIDPGAGATPPSGSDGGGATDPAAPGAGSDSTATGASDTTGQDPGADLATGLTQPPPVGDIAPDATQLLDGSAA